MLKNIMSLLCGAVFGAGLAISGMTDTTKVIGFLDVFGSWVPDLAFVMGAAVLITIVGFKIVIKQGTPVLDTQFYVPCNSRIDVQLLLGSAIFGVGWGMYGYCPGPVIASLAYLDSSSLIFIVSMFSGMFVFNLLGHEK